MSRTSAMPGQTGRVLVAALLAATIAACATGPPAGFVFSDPTPVRSLAASAGPWRTLRIRVPMIADDKTRALGTTDVRVATSDDGTARVDVFLYSPNMSWAARVFESTGMRIERDGELLLVEAGRADTNVRTGLSVGLQPMGGRPPDRDSAIRRLTIVIEAAVPEDIDVAVEIERVRGEALIQVIEGNVDIGSMVGNLQVHTGKGDLSVGEAAVPLGRLATDDGNIDVAVRRADSMRFVATRGDIEIRLAPRMHLDLDLRAREVLLGPGLDLEGSLSLQRVRGSLNGGGGALEASSPGGRIRVLGRG